MTVVSDLPNSSVNVKSEPRPDLPFILSGPNELVTASGCESVLDIEACAPEMLQTSDLFSDSQIYSDTPSYVVGALPFDRKRAPFLYRPSVFEQAALSTPEESRDALASLLGDASKLSNSNIQWRVTPSPSRDTYASNVGRALKLMHHSAMDLDKKECMIKKVVLARSLRVEAEGEIDPATLLRHLRKDPTITCFALPIPSGNNQEARSFIGATPELLVKKEGKKVFSHPLAGSIPRSSDPDIDREVASHLLISEKDLREHAAVVEWIADLLSPYCSTLSIPERPSLRSTNTMWHLGTYIDGELKDPGVSSLELASVLHPTPAVCGTPCDLAYNAIAELEPFDRGFFAGAIGWCNSDGDGQWMVAIRCAELSRSCATLYAGAGIVIGSDPLLEVQETAAKLTTLLNVFGINEDGQPVL